MALRHEAGPAPLPRQCEWLPGPPRPVLRDDEVHVWVASLEVGGRDLQQVTACLSDQERGHAQRLRRPWHRERYALAHAFMRDVLGRYLRCSAAQVKSGSASHGKPHLGARAGECSFNLSHSGDVAVLAATQAGEVGVDIERCEPLPDWREVARHFFSEGEQAALEALPPDQQLAGFYACWTRKEALVKACGLGLRVALQSFAVEVRPEAREPQLLSRSDALAGWRLTVIRTAPGYAGAVAAPVGAERVRLYGYSPREQGGAP